MAVRKGKRAGEGQAGANLVDEIDLLRGLLRRGLELSSGLGDPEQERELDRLMAVLDSLSRSAGRLWRLLATQRELADDVLFGETIHEALERAARRLAGGEGGEHGRG